jgi:hypothetical protein
MLLVHTGDRISDRSFPPALMAYSVGVLIGHRVQWHRVRFGIDTA